MIYGSVCSGVEAASLAWEPLGMNAGWFSQFDPEHNYKYGPDFPSAVLAHHWPEVMNLGDMTLIAARIATGEIEAPDLLVGGTPCQAFSVAGLRNGLNDTRGQLTLKYVELANAIDHQRAGIGKSATLIVWENVPGVLSSKDNAFGSFLAGLAGADEAIEPGPRPESGKSSIYWRWDKKTGEHVSKWPKSGCVYGRQRKLAWRVLDAQHFGVAQRRRRVFVVASARNDIDPAKILFEFDGVRRNSPPSRESRQAVAALTANGVGTCGADDNQAQAGHLIAAFGGGNCSGALDVAACLTAKGQRLDYEVETFAVQSISAPPDIVYALQDTTGRDKAQNGKGWSDEGTSYTIDTIATQGVALSVALRGREGGATAELGDDVAGTLRASSGGGDKPHVMQEMMVRRLMPVECERLQGFPDGHTDIPWKNKEIGETPDGPRYKAIGNSMAVPVMRKIGEWILREDAKTRNQTHHRAPGAGAHLPVSGSDHHRCVSLAADRVITGDDRLRSFLKWAGGKYDVLDEVAAHMPAGARLIEPFVGAGSIFLNFRYDAYLLADINDDLINLYRQLQMFPNDVAGIAEKLVADCASAEAYKAIRDEFNGRQADAVRHAALFLALNRTCFNGLCRFNQKGGFNVGWNKKVAPYFPLSELTFWRGRSATHTFACAHFSETIAQAGAGDVIFCDPPYEPMPDTSGFVSYGKDGFDFDEQVLLASALAAAHSRGARVVVTNSSAPKIMDLYLSHGFSINRLEARRSINRDGSGRKKVIDIIATL